MLNFADIVNFVFLTTFSIVFMSIIFAKKEECFSLLKMVMFQIFIQFWAFLLVFRVLLGVICAKYGCLG